MMFRVKFDSKLLGFWPKLPLKESINVKEGHSTTLSFSDEEKADVIVSETFGVLLLQDSGNTHSMVLFCTVDVTMFFSLAEVFYEIFYEFPNFNVIYNIYTVYICYIVHCQCMFFFPRTLGDHNQEGCLESFAHANQHLAKPKRVGGCRVPRVPCGGAQMLRLLSSKALRDATGGCLPEEFKHLACWRDTGRCSTMMIIFKRRF